MKKNTRRKLIQISFLILIGLISLQGTIDIEAINLGFITKLSFTSVSPIGGLESFISTAKNGFAFNEFNNSGTIFIIAVLLLGVLFGPILCGFICPLGTIQEIVGGMGKKIFKNRYNNFIPEQMHLKLKYLRYVVMFFVTVVALTSIRFVFADLDPYYGLFNFWKKGVAVTSVVMLTIVLLSALFIERPWCKYLCPYGAFLGVFNKIRVFKLKRDSNTCIGCKKCDKVCPMKIDISSKEVIDDLGCIACLECTSDNACPVDNTLKLGMSSNKVVALVLFVFVIAGGVLYAVDYMGEDVVVDKSTVTIAHEDVKEDETAGVVIKKIIVDDTGASENKEHGEENNEASHEEDHEAIPVAALDNIKGSTRLQNLIDLGVDKADLYVAFEIDAALDPEIIKVKDLMDKYTVDGVKLVTNGSIKFFMSEYTGMPIEEVHGDLPKSAYDILNARVNKQPEESSAVEVEVGESESNIAAVIIKEEDTIVPPKAEVETPDEPKVVIEEVVVEAIEEIEVAEVAEIEETAVEVVEEIKAIPKTEEVVNTSIYNDGIYEGTGRGYRKGLLVQVTISEGIISGIKVLKENEDEMFYMNTFELMTAGILEYQTTVGVDGISGATYTAIGFTRAVDSALEKAIK